MAQKITPFLWFDGQAEEAARYYCAIFKDAKLGTITPGPGGKALTVGFTLHGMDFVALNGGPQFKFTEATSFYVDCQDQAEVDYFWDRFTTDGGEPGRCGWLKDKFGVSWQIVPAGLGELIRDPRGLAAMLKMNKLEIAKLRAAVAG